MGANDLVSDFIEQWRRERPDLDPSPMAVIGRMRRLSDAFTDRLIENYRAYGIGEGEFDVMCALRREGEPFVLPQGAIAEHTMVTAGATSKRVDRLVRAELAERGRDSGDARGRLVSLTPRGVDLIDEMYPVHLATEDELLGPLDSDERRQLESLLVKLTLGVK